MAIYSLQPGENVPVHLSGKYMLFRSVTGGAVALSDPDAGIAQTPMAAGDTAELPSSKQVTLTCTSETAVTVDVQSAPFRIVSNNGAMTISGGQIDRIKESIKVDAQATVEDGSMTSLSPDTVASFPDVVIQAGQKARLMNASADRRRTVVIQNISASFCPVRVGAGIVGAGVGVYLGGELDAPASMELNTTGELWAYNDGATPATLTVQGVSRA